LLQLFRVAQFHLQLLGKDLTRFVGPMTRRDIDKRDHHPVDIVVRGAIGRQSHEVVALMVL
jgi:hypothetical protein